MPLVGKGTLADPIRPQFAPASGALDPSTFINSKAAAGGAASGRVDTTEVQEKKRKTEILAYSWVISDDKKSAIVEFVARDKAAFEEIRKSPLAKVFARDEIGRVIQGKPELSRDNVEAEFTKVRKDFKLNDLRTVVQ